MLSIFLLVIRYRPLVLPDHVLFPKDIDQPLVDTQSTIEPRIITNESDHLNLLWVWSDIQAATQNSISLQLVAGDGLLAVLGILDLTGNTEMIVLNGRDGKQVSWRITDQPSQGYPSRFALHKSRLYVGFSGGTGKVTAFDWQTGQEIWTHDAIGGRTISVVNADDDYVYVLTESGRFRLDISSGKKTIQPGDLEYYEEGILTDKIAYKLNHVPGSHYVNSVQAIDQTTDEAMWKTDHIISTIDLYQQTMFALTKDNQLIALNAVGGETIYALHFSPPAFTQQNTSGSLEAFHIAVDKEADLVYALLGDSRQLFAFEILTEAE